MEFGSIKKQETALKRAFILSITLHIALFLLVFLSPYFPKNSKKGLVHYVNLISLPGGGGGGGGGGKAERIGVTEITRRETLRDLTTPQKLEQQSSSSLRHPVEKPKKEIKPKVEKKASIQKQSEPKEASGAKREGFFQEGSGSGTGSGSGLRIGVGSGSGTGLGSGYASQIGLSTFPFTYYLQIILGKVSSNWFTSLVEPGLRGNFQTIVYFKILRNGQVSELKIEESSGVKSLDLSALRAVQSSAPFPPLPGEYEEDYLVIHLIFEHSK